MLTHLTSLCSKRGMPSSLCTHRDTTRQTRWLVFCFYTFDSCASMFLRQLQIILAILTCAICVSVSRCLFGQHCAECSLCCSLMQQRTAVMQGRPIYIQHLGQVNIKKIYDITTEERMLKFHVQEYERCIQYIMPACSKVAGRHIEQTFAILDVKGMTSNHGSKSYVCNIPYVALALFAIQTQPSQSSIPVLTCQPIVK